MVPIHICPSRDEVFQAGAEQWIRLAEDAIAQRGRFHIALSGGSTPAGLFKLLVSPSYAERVEWGKVEIYWGDERCVPPEDQRSNYRMAVQDLLSHVPLPESNIHRMRGELPPAQAADEYDALLRKQSATTADGVFRFDLVLLGMGDNGHTASLFPNTDALQATDRLVVANWVAEVDMWRLTLTANCINAARNVTFLVTGAEKAAMLKRVLTGPHIPNELPAQLIRPKTGALEWIVDAAAAEELS
ncbi:MAG: 6-phosphogluconolactonase [Planctomycetota bacterium]|nr:6-phosphogluconolactonase [Planctomycetota bacterium]